MQSFSTEFSTIDPPCIRCAYFPACSGCQIQDHVTFPPTFKDVECFFKSIDPQLEIPLISKEIIGWRTRAKLAIRGTSQNPQIGLFKKHTHDVVSIPDCPLHHPSILKAYAIVEKTIIETGISLYNEKKATGILRYVQFFVETESGRIQVCFVINQEKKNAILENFALKISQNALFSGVWFNYQTEPINRIFGEKWEHLYGAPYAWNKISGVSFAFHPACFSQAHLSLFEKIIESIQLSLLKKKRVLDLYSGVGVIGLSVAFLSESVVCSEINPFAKECFDLSRSHLDAETQKKTSFICGNSQAHPHLIDLADVVIVDPPRKGLDPSLLDKVATTPTLSQLIYVSCFFPSFQRDCLKLIEKGWKIKKAETYLLFPGTDQLETLCIFERDANSL